MLIDHSEELNTLEERLKTIRSTFDIEGKRGRVDELTNAASRPDFWDDTATAQQVMSTLAGLKDDVALWDSLKERCDDLQVLNDLSMTEGDEDHNREVEESLTKLARDIDDLELRSWFTGDFDENDAIVSIHPGAGGMESQDWAEMLLRLYTRWTEDHGFTVELNDVTPGEEAGIKNATLTVRGRFAFGFLQAEKGVHRLVRISPFDFQGRRHTSFASIDVIPVVEETIEVTIDPKDVRVETYRATGPGGQHVNVTDSAVRVTHIPTGLTAQCQSERSQMKNRETAMVILRSRLFERYREEREKELEDIRGEKKEIAWGSQIRSYVLHPYQMIKDHRTNFETGNVQAVLNGDIEGFIVAYHQWKAKQEG
ncbi:MAG: peptide chain release factor 2 [Candidatus Aquicultorales bacterium]